MKKGLGELYLVVLKKDVKFVHKVTYTVDNFDYMHLFSVIIIRKRTKFRK